MWMTILTGAASVAVLLGAGFLGGILFSRRRDVQDEAPARLGGQTLLSAADLRDWHRFLAYDGYTGEDEGV